ncbi:hypothetical protein V6N11_031232 [Hibiscus sabdariffa]|uniref:PRONE domain-containing protein n=1 Tax=Hibiscus sabdariffa TaxID=183260 RepID=A0ABR1ZE30_9ROSI
MENLSNSDENYDLGYQLSPSSLDQIDQSIPETPGYSTFSGGSFVYGRTYSGISAFSDPVDGHSCFSEASPFHWTTTTRSGAQNQAVLTRIGTKQLENNADEKQLDYLESLELELETMKERFAKLLLGEDMSGSGKGVCTAVTISNAITNLYATVFGQNLRLEPLNPEKKALWKREMNCLLSVCDYIVEFTTKSQNLRNGTAIDVMESRQRSDIYVNLPALRKLDAMLIEILDSFEDREFWYAEEGNLSSNSSRTGSFRRVVREMMRNGGCQCHVFLSPVSPRKQGSTCDTNATVLIKFTRQLWLSTAVFLPKWKSRTPTSNLFQRNLLQSGRDSIGDLIYRFMHATEKFSPDYLLDCLNIASEHEALELADRVEASMYTWRRKACIKHSKSSWGMVKELMSDDERSDKNHAMAERAESFLLALKHRYPELSQTTLDTCKIQHNRDVGQATLESYSRVVECLAFNIVAWIEDVFFVDTTNT